MRVRTFRLPENSAGLQSELRNYTGRLYGRCRWIGRHVTDDPKWAAFAAVTVWDSATEMDEGIGVSRQLHRTDLQASLDRTAPEVRRCIVYGAWQRKEEARLIRISRGNLVQGDLSAVDEHAVADYLANFESNPTCLAIAVGVGPAGHAVVATLWTSWDAIMSVTGSDLGKATRPFDVPGWSMDGTATHYEIVAADIR